MFFVPRFYARNRTRYLWVRSEISGFLEKVSFEGNKTKRTCLLNFFVKLWLRKKEKKRKRESKKEFVCM